MRSLGFSLLVAASLLTAGFGPDGKPKPKPTPKVQRWLKEPTGYRGLVLGLSTRDDLEQKVGIAAKDSPYCKPTGEFEENGGTDEGDQECIAPFEIGGADVTNTFYFKAGVLRKVKITVGKSDYQRVRDALIERYGQPTSSASFARENRDIREVIQITGVGSTSAPLSSAKLEVTEWVGEKLMVTMVRVPALGTPPIIDYELLSDIEARQKAEKLKKEEEKRKRPDF